MEYSLGAVVYLRHTNSFLSRQGYKEHNTNLLYWSKRLERRQKQERSVVVFLRTWKINMQCRGVNNHIYHQGLTCMLRNRTCQNIELSCLVPTFTGMPELCGITFYLYLALRSVLVLLRFPKDLWGRTEGFWNQSRGRALSCMAIRSSYSRLMLCHSGSPTALLYAFTAARWARNLLVGSERLQ